MPGLPKKYARMGFKKGWKAFKASKKTIKRKTRKVRNMPRRKRRRRRRVFRAIRRRKPKIPLEVAIALGAIPFTPSWTGAKSLVGDAQARDFEGLARQLKCGFLGFSPEGNLDLMGALNPFEPNRARYIKMLIAAGIMSKIRKKMVKIPFEKIPLIGRYIS